MLDPNSPATYQHLLDLTKQAELAGPRQVEWLVRLDTEHDKMQAVLAWSMGDSKELI